mmetsp:Transcript_116854/g.371979  ORF Transcript_116854/g.371979 Transcript_116854/m.371979 type:complete len:257 (+) Transcript_116854:381-1151(+)
MCLTEGLQNLTEHGRVLGNHGGQLFKSRVVPKLLQRGGTAAGSSTSGSCRNGREGHAATGRRRLSGPIAAAAGRGRGGWRAGRRGVACTRRYAIHEVLHGSVRVAEGGLEAPLHLWSRKAHVAQLRDRPFGHSPCLRGCRICHGRRRRCWGCGRCSLRSRGGRGGCFGLDLRDHDHYELTLLDIILLHARRVFQNLSRMDKFLLRSWELRHRGFHIGLEGCDRIVGLGLHLKRHTLQRLHLELHRRSPPPVLLEAA